MVVGIKRLQTLEFYIKKQIRRLPPKWHVHLEWLNHDEEPCNTLMVKAVVFKVKRRLTLSVCVSDQKKK